MPEADRLEQEMRKSNAQSKIFTVSLLCLGHLMASANVFGATVGRR